MKEKIILEYKRKKTDNDGNTWQYRKVVIIKGLTLLTRIKKDTIILIKSKIL